MSSEPIFAEERQNKILTMLKVCDKLLVNDLCEEFDVSPATIRNDLNFLEKQGLLRRTHGGAISCSKSNFELTSIQKQYSNSKQKQLIAEYAVNLIEDGDTIALDSGTTAYYLAELLTKKKDLTVVTTDTRVSQILENCPGISVILAGGVIRKGFSCTVGTITNTVLSSFHVDKVFMATNSVTSNGFLCTPNIEQANVKQTLISMGNQVFLLCDSSKFGTHSFAHFGNIKDVDLIITDSGINTNFASYIKDLGVSLITI